MSTTEATAGLLSGCLVSRANDFGIENPLIVFGRLVSRGLLSGGLVSGVSDFGSENPLISLECLGVYSLGVYSLGV